MRGRRRLVAIGLVTLALAVAGAWLVGCSDDDDKVSGPSGEPEPVYDLYVDVTTGSDGYSGSRDSCFKTITHALSVAQPGDSIKVEPGTYNAASGETFPITIPDSITLVGDVVNRGVGTDTVRIAGIGDYDGTNWATLVAGDNSVITGFYIYQSSTALTRYGMVSEDVTCVVVANTFRSEYGCIRLLGSGDPVIRDNTLSSRYYGVYSNCTGVALIRDNEFIEGSYIENVTGDANIIHNAFSGDTHRAISSANHSAFIDSNVFVGSYVYAALRFTSGATPTVRNTSITANAGYCVQILGSANPDLGTAAEPGGNTFASAGGPCVYSESVAMVSALGNTWPNSPPVCGTDIEVSGTGNVAFGPGAADTCEAPK